MTPSSKIYRLATTKHTSLLKKSFETTIITRNFRYLKWRVSKSLYFRLFWGWVFPYISRIHTAYIDVSYLPFRYLKSLVKLGPHIPRFLLDEDGWFSIEIWDIPRSLEQTSYRNRFWEWWLVSAHPSEKYVKVKMASSSPSFGVNDSKNTWVATHLVFPWKSKDYFLYGFSVKTIVLVRVYNQQFQGTILLMAFDFQGFYVKMTTSRGHPFFQLRTTSPTGNWRFPRPITNPGDFWNPRGTKMAKPTWNPQTSSLHSGNQT